MDAADCHRALGEGPFHDNCHTWSVMMKAQAIVGTGRSGTQCTGSGSNERIQEGFLEEIISESKLCRISMS